MKKKFIDFDVGGGKYLFTMMEWKKRWFYGS
jgi:hypothetical protein